MTPELGDALPGALHERLDPLLVPPGDLAEVRGRGRAMIRRRRRRRTVVVGGAAVLALACGDSLLLLETPRPSSPVTGVASVGPLDLSGGLRAHADPGHEVHLGGAPSRRERSRPSTPTLLPPPTAWCPTSPVGRCCSTRVG